MMSRTYRYGSAQVGGLGGLCLPAIVVELGQFLQLEFFGVYHFFGGEFALLELWYILFGTILLFFVDPLEPVVLRITPFFIFGLDVWRDSLP